MLFEISNLRFEILFGGHKAVVRPVPIPNTAVKHSLADGSGFIDSARVGCRQIFLPSRIARDSALFLSKKSLPSQSPLLRLALRKQTFNLTNSMKKLFSIALLGAFTAF